MDSFVPHQEIKKINELIRNYSNTQMGTEGLSESLRQILFGFTNVLGHIVNTFKTNAFKMLKDLKRSELRYYHESNMVSVNYVLRANIDHLTELQLDFPDKMSKTYLESSTAVMTCLQNVDMSNRIKSLHKQTKMNVDGLLTGTNTQVKLASDQFDLVTLAKYFSEVSACFSDKNHTKTKPFNKLFKLPKDLKLVDQKLLEGEKYLQEVTSVHEVVEKIEKLFQQLLDNIESDNVKNVTKDTLTNLSVFCTALSRLCDIYGYTVVDLQRLEHNFVEVLKMLRKKLRA